MCGWIGDSLDKLQLTLFTDADFAGDREKLHSTSGVFLAISGPNSFFPINAISKKQKMVSHSTTEAEILAMDLGLRLEGLPSLLLWEVILGYVDWSEKGFQLKKGFPPIHVELYQDNTATSRIAWTGKAPTLRHVQKVHGVSVRWVHEQVRSSMVELIDCHTDAQAADIFTKFFINPPKWHHNLALIGTL